MSTQGSKIRKGSRSRCLAIVSGADSEAAQRLSSLIAPLGMVSSTDYWMPCNHNWTEHRLGRTGFSYCSDREDARELLSWWLAVYGPTTQTPNADIFSTCSLDNRPGLLFVEAKAHSRELKKEEAGKSLSDRSSQDNHLRIGRAILEARDELNRRRPGFNISRDSHYQMSNRFAWAWRLASRGTPVALIYLGFLGATEMAGPATVPFNSPAEWEGCLLDHSRSIIPESVWGDRVPTNGAPIYPRICSMRIAPLTTATTSSGAFQ